MDRRWIFGIASATLAVIAIACGSGDDDSLGPGGPGAEGVPNPEPALLPDGAVNPEYCPSGQTECGAGVCVDTATDDKNCGTCGTVCGGTCTAGRCVVTLASGGTGAAIAVDATHVYFSSAAGLMRVPVGGGTATALAPGANGAVVVDATNVYYSTAGGVMSLPLAGGKPTQLGIYPANGITVNAKGVCWTTGLGEVVSVPLPVAPDGGVEDGGLSDDGGEDASPPPPPPTTLASNQYNATGIIADSHSVFWATNGTISSAGGFTPLSGTVRRFDLSELAVVADDGGAPIDDGGTPDAGSATIASGQNYPFAIALDTSNVYWTACGTTGNTYADGTVMKAPQGGGAPVTLASGQAFPYGIATDSTNVYWVNNDSAGSAGAVMSVPVAGGSPVAIVSGLQAPTFIAVDATSVYWTTSAGAVMKATPK